MNSYGYYAPPKSDDVAVSRTATAYDQPTNSSHNQEPSQQQQLATPSSAAPSSGSAGHYSPDGQFKVVRRRNRVPLSCGPCRSRKLKCNRSSPCENCVKRGDAMSCSYAQSGGRKRQTVSSQSNNTPDDMQNRIDRLEGLVLSLMTNGNQSAGPTAAQRALSIDSGQTSIQQQDVDLSSPDGNSLSLRGEGSEESETDQVASSLGVMKVDNNSKSTIYIGDAHWAAVLSDISEVKNYFQEHKKQYEEQVNKVQQAKADMDSTLQGPMFLFGGTNPPDFPTLLRQMPKRTVADRLITRYFNIYDPAVHILHPPSWYRETEKFWLNPEASSPAWVGQMFTVFCLAMHSYHSHRDEPNEFRGKSLETARHYRNLAGQCLALADFTRPVNHIVETLVLYLHCEYSRARDTEFAVWVLVGIIVRVAMRMGYHRDPKYYANITPFQGELRRRVWTFVRQSDLLFSFQVGLPSMIRDGDCDTELPRNLYDDEFDESTEVLPASRPLSEPTNVSYMRAKATMSFAFGKIVERLHTTKNYTYDDVMELDQHLRNCLAEIPPHLRMKSIEESGQDSASLIMQRFNLYMLYHKGQCVLHRKFSSKARENNRYTHSRRTCIDSSMDLLRIQEILHLESRPHQRLQGMNIFISSLNATDFLLAAMIVALDLCSSSESETSAAADLDVWGSERKADMGRALEVAQSIWKENMDHSMEAFKAYTVLQIMLNKMRSSRLQQGRGSSNPFAFLGPMSTTENGQVFRGGNMDERPEHSAAMTLGMLSSGGIGSNSGQMNGPGETSMNNMPGASELIPGYGLDQLQSAAGSSGPNSLSFFDGAILTGMDTSGGEANIDWDAFDSYLQSANLGMPTQQQQQQQQPPVQQQQEAGPAQQQPWPASVDPSLAPNASLDGPGQPNSNGLNAPNAFMGGPMGM